MCNYRFCHQMHKFLGLSVCRARQHLVRVSATSTRKFYTFRAKLHPSLHPRAFLIRTCVIVGVLTIPLQNTKMATSKSGGESVMTKTIQLTSAQMVKYNSIRELCDKIDEFIEYSRTVHTNSFENANASF